MRRIVARHTHTCTKPSQIIIYVRNRTNFKILYLNATWPWFDAISTETIKILIFMDTIQGKRLLSPYKVYKSSVAYFSFLFKTALKIQRATQWHLSRRLTSPIVECRYELWDSGFIQGRKRTSSDLVVFIHLRFEQCSLSFRWFTYLCKFLSQL